MSCVLLAGLSADLEPWLLRRLGELSDLTLETARTGEEALGLLARGRHRVLVVDDHLAGMHAGKVLAQARRDLGLADLRVIYCVERDGPVRDAGDLSSILRPDDQMVFHPVDREKLAQDVLAASAPEGVAQAENDAGGNESLDDLAADLWVQFRDQIFGQVSAIEEGVANLLDANPDPAWQKKAQREAHKLAGSLGSLGFAEGSKLAREADQTLRSELVS